MGCIQPRGEEAEVLGLNVKIPLLQSMSDQLAFSMISPDGRDKARTSCQGQSMVSQARYPVSGPRYDRLTEVADSYPGSILETRSQSLIVL